MSHYKSNLRDIEFNLFEVLRRQDLLGQPPYPDLDEDTARSILAELDSLATGPLAASFADADRNPPVFDPATNSVRVPESLRKSYRAFMDAEWYRLALPTELGGTPAPPSLNWAVAELTLGANPAVWLYASGFPMARALWYLGTQEQKRFAQLAIEREWGGTMVLTEPDAGSDVGAGRTRAVPQPDGSWHIEGVKRFITSAEHDLAENIFHLVLARPEGSGPGTKGLSMFLVPKYLVSEDGTLGERNGVFATNVEHKMGLKASATCELTFGADRPAVGTLVGGVHDGIRQMFRIIEEARMMVGSKAIATLSTGYLNALDFARSRVQGADLTEMLDKAAPRVTIIHHPDVRRMLMRQKAYAEGLRALLLYTATIQDTLQIAAAEGRSDESAAGLNDLLLPLVKGVGSERSYELLTVEPADPGRLRISPGLPDRAVRQGREDRQPVRGHDRDPEHGPVLPQDHQGQRQGARHAAGHDQGLRRRQRHRGRRRRAAGRAGRPGRRGRTGGGHCDGHDGLPDGVGGYPGRDLQGRAEHHQAADGAR